MSAPFLKVLLLMMPCLLLFWNFSFFCYSFSFAYYLPLHVSILVESFNIFFLCILISTLKFKDHVLIELYIFLFFLNILELT